MCNPDMHLQFWDVTYALQQWYELQVDYYEFKFFSKDYGCKHVALDFWHSPSMVLCEMVLKALKGRFRKPEKSDLYLVLLHNGSALWKLI